MLEAEDQLPQISSELHVYTMLNVPALKENKI